MIVLVVKTIMLGIITQVLITIAIALQSQSLHGIVRMWNLACNIPNACSTSFRFSSWAVENTLEILKPLFDRHLSI